MSNPDAAAAATFDPHPVQANKLMHDRHVGAKIQARDTSGALADFAVTDGGVALSIQQDGRPFVSVVNVNADELINIVEPAPPSPYDETGNAEARTPEHIVWAREMAQISDAIKAHTGELEGLKERYAALSEKVMAYYEMAGDRKLPFDGRSANLRIDTYARFKDRPAEEGGGKYDTSDVVAALRKIGRTGDIKPESVHPSTLASILREYRDERTPVPPELDALVELGENPKIVITKPAPGRR